MKIRSGQGTMIIKSELEKMISQVIKKTIPNFEKSIQKEMKDIFDNAKKNWLIRRKGISQRSIDKLDFGVKFEGLKVIGFVSNMAPYAWVIKVSTKHDSNTKVKKGKRLASVLLEQPLKKASKSLTEKLANDLINLQRKS